MHLDSRYKIKENEVGPKDQRSRVHICVQGIKDFYPHFSQELKIKGKYVLLLHLLLSKYFLIFQYHKSRMNVHATVLEYETEKDSQFMYT